MNPTRILLRALAAMACIAFYPSVHADLVPAEHVPRTAEPLLIVSPKYPDDALADKKQVEVRVKGQVTENGSFGMAEYSAGEGEEAFVQAVRDVLPYWRFEPNLDNQECKPKAYDAQLTVWFEMTEKGPAISASMPPPRRSGTSTPAKTNEPVFKRKFVKWQPSMSYPIDAYRKGVEGRVSVMFKIDRSGKVLAVNLFSYSPNEMFNEDVLDAAREFVFNPQPEYPREVICGRFDFQFCLRNGLSIALPDAGCRPRRGDQKFQRGRSLMWKVFE